MAESPAVPSLPQRCTITRAGASFGPYTLEEIKAYTAEGRIFVTDQAWPEGATLPTTVAALLNPQGQRDVTDGVIPYRNPAALASYYVGLSGVIPVLGILTGIAAVFLGIRGLKRFHAEPWRRGKIHSYAGILVGSVTSLTWIAMLVWFIPQMLRTWLRYHH